MDNGDVIRWRQDGQDECPVADTIEMLSGKWKPRVIHMLMRDDLHFLELVRGLPGASRKVLSAQLKELEAAGIVARTELEDARRRVRYSLTRRGQHLSTALSELFIWSVATGKEAVEMNEVTAPRH